jgi:hypothetical protein
MSEQLDFPNDADLQASMQDDSSFDRATAAAGKQVGTCFVGDQDRACRVMPANVTATESLAAGLSRIPIIYNGRVNGRPEWELVDEVRFFDATLGCFLIAPKGYKFDLASIPRPLWGVIAPFELSTLAPLFHDLIYEFKGNLPQTNVIPFPFHRLTQKDADDLFFRLMEQEGVSGWKRYTAYIAVRAAGWTYWNT